MTTALWEQLQRVNAVTLRSEGKEIWEGWASVHVACEDQTLIFEEKGEWEGKNLSFTNTLRWTLHPTAISLEHLRLKNPVFLARLIPASSYSLKSAQPHLCGRDRYSAHLSWDETGIHLHWKIEGPLKYETLYHHYKLSSI